MFRNVPPAQRRMVILSVVALALAIAFVVVAVIFAAGRPAVREGEYEPFEVGDAGALGRAIATGGPIFFPDPTGGDRGFLLAVEAGELVGLHVVPPGGSPDCPVDWNRDDEIFTDCEGRMWRSVELRRFPTTIDDEGLVVVDLRRTLPAPEPTPSG